MKISIIVPVFNMASDGKLDYCLDSLVNQTIKDMEIIAVDDASTDDSLLVLEKYKERYPDIFKVIAYKDNRHQGGARNEGMKAAAGEWIGFIDSDDWVSPDYYEALVKKGEETGADIVGSHFTITHEHSFDVKEKHYSNSPKQTGILNHETKKELLLNIGSLVMKIYRRSMIEENNLSFPEHMFYEDNAAGPAWMMAAKRFEIVDGPLYYYYMHGDSTVHTINLSRSRDRLKAMDIMISEAKEHGFYDEFKDELEAVYIRLYLVNTLFGYMIDGKNRKYSFVREIKKGMLKTFPDFRNNPYYASIPDAEQKRMIDLFMKNAFAFYVYYGALWAYRNFRKR